MLMNDYISRVVFRYVTIYYYCVWFYVILHGSLSPGGGFGGGTVHHWVY